MITEPGLAERAQCLKKWEVLRPQAVRLRERNLELLQAVSKLLFLQDQTFSWHSLRTQDLVPAWGKHSFWVGPPGPLRTVFLSDSCQHPEDLQSSHITCEKKFLRARLIVENSLLECDEKPAPWKGVWDELYLVVLTLLQRREADFGYTAISVTLFSNTKNTELYHVHRGITNTSPLTVLKEM